MTRFFAVTLAVIILVSTPMPRSASAAETAFDQTPVGEYLVRELPAGRQLVVSEAGSYFERNGSLFRRLFDYIKSNDIAMTVPVEGALDRAEMRFYAGSAAAAELPNENTVRVNAVSPRLVASLGARGSYREANVQEARQQLEAWVASRDDLTPSGSAYAVFWNGPFTLPFLRRFEVHLPVTR